MRCLAGLLFVAVSACALPTAVDNLHRESPAPELGRPGWVREPARVGAWIGGAFGTVVSIVALPVTLPISWLADEQLGNDRDEFLFGMTSIGASTGHYVIGAPLDGLDWVFRRAWVDGPSGDAREKFVLQPAPVGPAPVPPASTSPADASAASSD